MTPTDGYATYDEFRNLFCSEGRAFYSLRKDSQARFVLKGPGFSWAVKLLESGAALAVEVRFLQLDNFSRKICGPSVSGRTACEGRLSRQPAGPRRYFFERDSFR